MVTLLITGFGPFPGVAHNPSEALIAALDKRRMRFEHWGVRLELRILPVLYAAMAPRLGQLMTETKPDAILHFGLAGGRKTISIETCARNRVSSRLIDAGGARAENCSLLSGGPAQMKTRIPAAAIVANLRRAGIAAQLSRDAGAYVCNATFFHSLASQHSLPVGFIHIPWPTEEYLSHRDARPSFADILKAAEIAILRTALAARQRLASGPSPTISQLAMPLGR